MFACFLLGGKQRKTKYKKGEKINWKQQTIKKTGYNNKSNNKNKRKNLLTIQYPLQFKPISLNQIKSMKIKGRLVKLCIDILVTY
jgi:hypothetical protein